MKSLDVEAVLIIFCQVTSGIRTCDSQCNTTRMVGSVIHHPPMTHATDWVNYARNNLQNHVGIFNKLHERSYTHYHIHNTQNHSRHWKESRAKWISILPRKWQSIFGSQVVSLINSTQFEVLETLKRLTTTAPPTWRSWSPCRSRSRCCRRLDRHCRCWSCLIHPFRLL